MSCFFALTTWLICLRSAEGVFCHSGPEVCGGWDKRSVCWLVLCQNRKLSRSQRHRFMSGKIRISCPQSGGGEGKSQTEQGNLLRRVVCCVSLWVERCQDPFFANVICECFSGHISMSRHTLFRHSSLVLVLDGKLAIGRDRS